MNKLYRFLFEVMYRNPGEIRQFSVQMPAHNFKAAVESAELYIQKHMSEYPYKEILGIEYLGELTKPDAP